jgi:uncharacterized membrane protein YkvA (DUF1232 family)
MANNRDVTNQVGVLQSLLNRGRLVWRLLRDPRVPVYLKVIPAAAVLYVLSPLDFIPDIAVGLGQLDDIGILLVGLEGFIAMCPQHIVDEHLAAIQGGQGYTPSSRSSRADTIDGEWHVK